MTVGDFVKAYRKQHGLSQRQFAEMCGLSNGYVSMLEANKSPRTGEPIEVSLMTLRQIAEAINLTVSDIIRTINPDPDLPPGVVPASTQRVPVLGSIHAGDPTFAEEDFEAYVEAGSSIRCDFALRVVGDSMIGARIEDGDIVFIRKQDTVDNGEIAAVLIDDETTLKRVRFLPGGLTMLSPENPRYEPIIVGGENETRVVRILGKAVAFQSDVR